MNTVSVEFTQDDLNALAQILDVAVKATGLQGARSALAILAKLEAAVAVKKQTEETHDD